MVYRLLQRLPTRMLSLRTIVIVAALAVVVLVLTLGTWVWVGVTNDQYSQFDRRLDSVSSLGDFSTLLSGPSAPGSPSPDGNLVRTVRVGLDGDVGAPRRRAAEIRRRVRQHHDRRRRVPGSDLHGGRRVDRTGAPVAETQRRITELHWRVVLICGGVIIGTVVVGWFFSLIMIDPFRLLAQQARAINAQSKPEEVQVRGVREAVEIGEAVEGMLARIGDEQARTRAALESARDFAAVASHELRTPLTAMRTNLEVLSTLELGDEQRKEVIGDTDAHPEPDRGHPDRAGAPGPGRTDHRRRFRPLRHHRAARPRRP